MRFPQMNFVYVWFCIAVCRIKTNIATNVYLRHVLFYKIVRL